MPPFLQSPKDVEHIINIMFVNVGNAVLHPHSLPVDLYIPNAPIQDWSYQFTHFYPPAIMVISCYDH